MKLKTRKAMAKRFQIKRRKKGIAILKRTDGQDHFNARERSKTTRNKRRDKIMSPTVKKMILHGMPNV